MLKRAYGENPDAPSPLLLITTATAEKTANIAATLYDAGYRAQARTLYEHAVPMYRARVPADHPPNRQVAPMFIFHCGSAPRS